MSDYDFGCISLLTNEVSICPFLTRLVGILCLGATPVSYVTVAFPSILVRLVFFMVCPW